MYQLRLTKSEYLDFKKKVKCELIMRDWTYRDLAKETRYSQTAINHFFGDNSPYHSRFIAYAIAEVLDMEIK